MYICIVLINQTTIKQNNMRNCTTKAEIARRIYQLNDEARKKYEEKKLKWTAPLCIRGIDDADTFIAGKRYEKCTPADLKAVMKQLQRCIQEIEKI